MEHPLQRPATPDTSVLSAVCHRIQVAVKVPADSDENDIDVVQEETACDGIGRSQKTYFAHSLTSL